jgi:DNA-binding transcriptional LysR family regulator
VPSAISYTIQKLEQDLDVLVFDRRDRRGHRAILTSAGRELLDQGRHLLRATESLEARIQRVATGWEASLVIAFDALLPIDAFYPVVDEFYRQHAGTCLRLTREVLGGTWDALVSRRADLVIGTVGEGPPGGGYSIQPLGLRFAVGVDHPLAEAGEPLSPALIQQHRAVAIADTSRVMAPRSAGLLSGQDVFTVPDLESKIHAHAQGLGIGYLPQAVAEAEQRAGRLRIKAVDGVLPDVELATAWRSDHEGKALRWFLERLAEPHLIDRLLKP